MGSETKLAHPVTTWTSSAVVKFAPVGNHVLARHPAIARGASTAAHGAVHWAVAKATPQQQTTWNESDMRRISVEPPATLLQRTRQWLNALHHWKAAVAVHVLSASVSAACLSLADAPRTTSCRCRCQSTRRRTRTRLSTRFISTRPPPQRCIPGSVSPPRLRLIRDMLARLTTMAFEEDATEEEVQKQADEEELQQQRQLEEEMSGSVVVACLADDAGRHAEVVVVEQTAEMAVRRWWRHG